MAPLYSEPGNLNVIRSIPTNDMDINIRVAAIGDAHSVAELFDLYRQFYEQAADLPLATAFITERINKKQSVILLASANEVGPIGFCQLYPTFCSVEAQPIYSLYDLFVRPVARRTGVGQMLLQAAEEHARVNGKARMDLTTARTNHQAQRLYESMGWVRDEVFFAYSRHVGDSSEPCTTNNSSLSTST
jgi:ribosomal protein S18 acetylase RimI-like enzyme